MSRNSVVLVRRALLPAATILALAAMPSAAQDQPSVAKGDRITSSSMNPTVSLPNGASSINETYGDWTVSCSLIEGEKACVFSQVQGNSRTGQRSFAVELQAPKDGKTNGMLLMPFGLKLDDGVKLKIDEQNLGQGARFSTCVPAGCLVPVSFPTAATDAMKRGEKLIVTATHEGSDEPPTFSVSLMGFTAAINRAVELAK